MSPALDPALEKFLQVVLDRVDDCLEGQKEIKSRLEAIERSNAEDRGERRATNLPDLAERVRHLEVAGGAIKAKAAIIWTIVCAVVSALVSAAFALLKGGGTKQ